MTDKEIVKNLIERDDYTTRWFYYVKCRPLFLSLIKKLFTFPVSYDEFVDEVVLFLMENDASRLKQFDYQSSIFLWLRTCLIRHFLRKQSEMIEERSKEPLLPVEEKFICAPSDFVNAKIDIDKLLVELEKVNKRYAYVIRRIMLEDAPYEMVASELNVMVANLYNIKKRALAELTKIALSEQSF